MKKIILALALLIAIPCVLFSQKRVRGYYRKNGTYVQSYHRTKSDGKMYNNYSTKGNVNPYTGDKGTKVTKERKSRKSYKY